MKESAGKKKKTGSQPSWKETVDKYQTPDPLRSWWQVVNTLVPYFALWGLMVYSLRFPYWVTLLLSVPAAGFLVRTFIIFHDCGHGSLFASECSPSPLITAGATIMLFIMPPPAI